MYTYFESHIYHQLERYISSKPDPEAIAIHVFSVKWNNESYYLYYLSS